MEVQMSRLIPVREMTSFKIMLVEEIAISMLEPVMMSYLYILAMSNFSTSPVKETILSMDIEHGQRISFNDDDSDADADADADTDADIYIDLSIVREGKTGSFFVNASNTLGDDETYRSAHFQVDGNLSIPTDAVSYDDHSYYVFNDVNADWYEAEDFAESLGGHLVIITSEGEQSVVQQMIDTLDNADAKAHYWLGATIDSDKHYRWVDGTSVNDNSYKNLGTRSTGRRRRKRPGMSCRPITSGTCAMSSARSYFTRLKRWIPSIRRSRRRGLNSLPNIRKRWNIRSTSVKLFSLYH